MKLCTLASFSLTLLSPLSSAQETKLTPSDGSAGDQFGQSVAVNDDTAIVGSPFDDDNGADSGSAYLFDISTGTQLAKLTASDSTAGDNFGRSVSISGTMAIVGAPLDGDNGATSGSAYLFDTTTGAQIAKLTASDGAAGDNFGCSVSISGTTAIVGAEFDDDNGADSGSAYLFDITTGTQIAKLTASDGAGGHNFGCSVAISDNTAIVGAPSGISSPQGLAAGAAYLFDASTGAQTSKIFADAGWAEFSFHRKFGFSVAIRGDRAIVGAVTDEEGQGAAYLYDTTSGTPNIYDELVKYRASDGWLWEELGVSVAITESKTLVGAHQADGDWSSSGAAYLYDSANPDPNWAFEELKFIASDGATGDRYGNSVAINNHTAVIGACLDDDNGTDSGSIYLIDISGSEPPPPPAGEIKLTANDAERHDYLGLSVAISGSITVIGAQGDEDNGFNSGSAYLFDTTSGAELSKLIASDGQSSDYFGSQVAISGTTVIVSAVGDDDNGAEAGAAYLFDISDSTSPTETFKLKANDGIGGDNFGESVAVSGTTAIIGSDREGSGPVGVNPGSAYVFDTTTGTQIGKFTASDAAIGDAFGCSIAISGTIAVIGAWGDDDNGPMSGSAYLFDISNPNAPTEVAKLKADDGAEDDFFGRSVGIKGNAVIIGAPGNDDHGFGSGSAYLFDATTGAQIAKLTASDGAAGDDFGRSVGISDTKAIVGASMDDTDTEHSGSAYIFDLTNGAELQKLTAYDSASDDWFGSSTAISNTTAVVGNPGDDGDGSYELNNSGSAHLYDLTTDPGTSFCFGDGTGTACPCGNTGGAGEGCANDTGSGGMLTASGSNSVLADDLVFEASGLTSGPGLYFQGNNAVNGGAGNTFGDGLRCAGNQVVRLEVQFSSAGSSATSISVATKGGVNAGETKRYQLWYRDSGGSPCDSQFNLTNGYEITWTS